MNQAGSSRMDTVLKMLLIAFISLLAFSSGVYFGKQMSDSDYQLKALEGDFHNSGKTAAHGKAKDLDVDSEEAIRDDEVAALSDKFVNAEKGDVVDEVVHEEDRKVASTEGAHDAPAAAAAPATASSTKPAAGHGPAETLPPKHDLSAAHKAAERIANNTAPAEAAKPEVTNRVPTSLPKTIGASPEVEFTVQVAAYPTAEAAKEHANELIKKGFPAFPVEARVGGTVWYRVSVGSFKTMKEATSYRAQLLQQADVQTAIVQRIQR